MEKVCNIIGLNVIAEVELIYRRNTNLEQMVQIKSPETAYTLFLENWGPLRIDYLEQCKMLLLNRCNYVLGIYEVSTGGISGTVVDPKLVFTAALKMNASGLIFAHNHPSGNSTPSTEDQKLTKKLCEAGSLLDIKILDHLVITSDRYFSFSDKGLL